MSATTVIDLFWGDNGKGKIVDYLSTNSVARNYKHVVRFAGGQNAGHTLYRNDKKYVCNMVPCGLLNENVKLYIGAGCVVDIRRLVSEIEEVELALGRKIDLSISNKIHVITALDHEVEAVREKLMGIGTTKKGIGPCYASKANRNGLRLEACASIDQVMANLQKQDGASYVSSVELQEIARNIVSNYNKLATMVNIDDVEQTIRDLLRNGEDVLFEGAQGTFLDIGHGDYPFCTSSHTVASAAATYCGFPAREIQTVIGVLKPYITRVGNGPVPHEIHGELATELRELGGEYGAVTGRPRRVAWVDLGLLTKACQINGVTHLAITKMDIAGKMPLIVKKTDGTEIKFNGWTSVEEPEAVRFVQLIQQTAKEASDATVAILGIGPNTTDVIGLDKQFVTR